MFNLTAYKRQENYHNDETKWWLKKSWFKKLAIFICNDQIKYYNVVNVNK